MPTPQHINERKAAKPYEERLCVTQILLGPNQYLPLLQRGEEVAVLCRDLTFKFGSVEPFFCTLALYDAHEERKISEDFHFHVNTPEQLDTIGLSTVCHKFMSSLCTDLLTFYFRNHLISLKTRVKQYFVCLLLLVTPKFISSSLLARFYVVNLSHSTKLTVKLNGKTKSDPKLKLRSRSQIGDCLPTARTLYGLLLLYDYQFHTNTNTKNTHIKPLTRQILLDFQFRRFFL